VTDFKSYKKELYCTSLDLRLFTWNFLQEYSHTSLLEFTDPRIDMAIMRGSAVVDLKLGKIISGDSALHVTPFPSPILIPYSDTNGEGENEGSCILEGVIINSSAYTEYWTLTFTSSTAFTLKGSISGSQGSGLTSAAFTSTNGDITIPADAWSGTPATGDKFYFASYRHHQSIVLLATMLSTGLVFKGLDGRTSGEESAGAKLYKDALSLLNEIVTSDAGLIGINTSISCDDILAPYEINRFGFDVTGYRAEPFNKYLAEGGTTGTSVPWYML
jgi:hypothetical protein